MDENASGVSLSNESTEGIVVKPNFEEAVLEDVLDLAERVVLEDRRRLLDQKPVGVPTNRNGRIAESLDLIAFVVSASGGGGRGGGGGGGRWRRRRRLVCSESVNYYL